MGGDRGARPACPIQRAIGLEPEPRLRPVEPHVEYQRLAAQEGSKLRAHRKLRDLNQRCAAVARSDADVVERDRRKGNETRIDAAVDHHGLAHDAACLPLEIVTKAGPVDKQGCDQRGKERDNQQSSEGNQNSRQHRVTFPSVRSPPALRL